MKFLILLLLLYGVISVGLLWWYRLGQSVIITCGAAGVVVGYFVFTHNVDIVIDFFFPISPEDEFASVEYVMKGEPVEFRFKHFFWSCGWVIGLAYFGLLCVISNALPRRSADKAQG